MNRKQRRAEIKAGGSMTQAASSAVQQVFVTALHHFQAARLVEAERLFRQVLAADPRHADSLHLLGVIAYQTGRHDSAADLIGEAITINPREFSYRSNLGNLLLRQGRVDEAAALYRTAIDIKPDHPVARYNLGNARREQRRLDEAVACYCAAIGLKPDYPEAHHNLGLALQEQGRWDEGVSCYRKAIELRPDYSEAHYNLAMALLACGEMAAGWIEHEWRWTPPQFINVRRGFSQPQWRGQAAAGRALLIHAEQGLGDTIQFCRYAPLAAARGLRVILEVPNPLVRLIRSLPGVDKVVAQGEALPQFDLHCPMLSMPMALGTTITTIPSNIPYLHADAWQVAAWQTRLAALQNRGHRVGLVWAGNPRKQLRATAAIDRRRSIAPERLAPLLELPGLHFFSLQKDGPATPDRFPLTDFMAEMGDFADTAALIANLDLIISVDTSVAHLAAAMGKPVWLLDRFDACWRWLVGRRDSPWYPGLRLYRQPQPGDWHSVLAEVARDLRSLSIA
jgi:tetratricopeptide (TPR) repeat protein